MSSLDRVDEHRTSIEFDENIFDKPTQTTISPLKMHTVHIEEKPVPEIVDISLTPSPLSTPNNTPVAQSSPDELESLHETLTMDIVEEQVPESQMQQKPPAIPPKSPLRGAKKTNWLSRLLSKTVRRLGYFHKDHRKKARSRKATKRHKHRKASVGSSPPVITIPDLGGIADFGDIFADYFANSADCGGDLGDCAADCGGDSADNGGNCDF